MGYHLIEFNGLPGCGKSTLTDVLHSALQRKGYIVLNDQDVYETRYKILKLIDFFKAIFYIRFFKFNILMFFLGMKILSKSKSTITIYKVFKIIRYNQILYNKVQKNQFDYLIMSEGFIQFFASLLDEIDYKQNKIICAIICEIITLHGQILMVNCNIEIDESISRVEQRTSKPNSVDLMEENKRNAFMDRRNNNMKELRECCKNKYCFFEINMLQPVENNLSYLLSKLV